MTLDELYNLIAGIKTNKEKKAREPTKINYYYNNLMNKRKEKT